MPSDTSVSMDEDRCLAWRSAAWWNGQADHVATGAASTTSSHCQPGNRDQGNSDSTIDRSVSGTKNTSASISRRRSRRTAASSARARGGVGAVGGGVGGGVGRGGVGSVGSLGRGGAGSAALQVGPYRSAPTRSAV